jgi:ABC-2 type transport system ATP-binding protein
MILVVDRLVKAFGPRRAVDRLSFSVDEGEVVGLLGANGAGKTTTMRMIAGFLEPDAGTAKIFNIDVAQDRRRAQERVGYLPEGAPVYGEMTPMEYLHFVAAARGIAKDKARNAVRRVAADTNLGDSIERPIETLSKGFRRRVALAASLIHDPLLMVLDEPTDGLDPNQRRTVRELIGRLAQERALIISTHSLEEVEAVCTRAIIIHHGRLVADAKPADLAAQHGGLEAAFRVLTGGEEGVS